MMTKQTKRGKINSGTPISRKASSLATRPQSWSGATFEFKGVVCKKWPGFKGYLQNCRGQQSRPHCSLRWTPHCLFVPSVDRFHILLLKWMINLERTRGDCGNETKAVMAGLMSFKPSFYDELKRQLSSSDAKLQISSLRPEEAQWNATESQNSCL